MSVRKHASIATLAVAGSRFMGLIREMVFAFFFGAGPALDAFIAAFRIPNLLRDLFAEGALSTAFVTVFSKKAAQEGDKAAWRLGRIVFTFIILFMGIVVLLGILFSPQIIKVVASGFQGEKLAFTVLLNRLLFPFILFVSLAAVAMGILNSKGKFALPQSASTFFNVTSIVTGLLLAYALSPDYIIAGLRHLMGMGPRPTPDWGTVSHALTGMALGTLLGGFVQWFVQMPSLRRLGFIYRFEPHFRDPDFIRVLKLTVPAIIGGAAVQINVLVNTNFASYLADGSISWLNYAFRLMQFPIGLFGVAIASATTPALSRLVVSGDLEALKKTLRESTQMALFLCIPSALGLIALAEPIMALIYQYGRFTAFDSVQSAHALSAYAIGLSFYALIKIYQPVFLVHNDARSPMVVSLISIGINIALNWFLAFHLHFNHWGLALGTSGVAIWNAFMLTFLMRKKIPGFWDRGTFGQIARIVVAAAMAVGSAFFLKEMMQTWVGIDSFTGRLATVFVPMGAAVILYAGASLVLGVSEVRVLKDRLTRKKK